MKRVVLTAAAAGLSAALAAGAALAIFAGALRPRAAGIEARLVKAVERVLPSTVSIHLREERPAPLFLEELSRLLEGRRFHTAAGVAVREGGYVLTNAHVVREFEDFYVVTRSGKVLSAKPVGMADAYDVALIKVEEDLPPVEFCRFDNVKVGRFVFSVGSPYDLPFSVSVGVISALHRGRLGFCTVEDYLQTDAAVNPGSSGGPLCDLDGRLVGINSALYSLKSGSNGINFAVPVYLLKPLIDKMIEGRPAVEVYLGAHFRPPDISDLQRALLDEARGATAYKVYSGSPAEAAGLKKGDVVLEMDGEPVATPWSLRARLLVKRPGDGVEFLVARGAKRLKLKVELSARDERDPPSLYVEALGMLAERPDDETLARAGAEFGAVVDSADYGGTAYMLGLRSGDVILEVNGRRFRTLSEFAALAEEAVNGGEIRVRYYSATDSIEKESSTRIGRRQ